MRSINVNQGALAADDPSLSLVHSLARGALFGMLALLYSGGFDFLVLISSSLLYFSYVMLLGGVAVCLLAEKGAISRLESVAPYMAWIIFYCAIGTIVTLYRPLVIGDATRALLRNLFILSALALLLKDRRSMAKFATFIQIVALLNCAICVWGFYDPSLISRIAFALNGSATAFSESRPAGLWANPNAAAFGFLFALLLSHWARNPLGILGRMAAVAGIYLTVSRSGMYLLIGCCAVYVLHKRKSIQLNLSQITLLVSSLAVAIGVVWVLAYRIDTSKIELLDSGSLSRITDFKENNGSATQDGTRANLTTVALGIALKAPWYGYGIMSFQGSLSYPFTYTIDVGAHNIYIVVLGETGIPGIVAYSAVLIISIVRFIKARIATDDRVIIELMWLCYLFIGMVWHNQFTSVVGMILVGLLYHMPRLAQSYPHDQSVG